MKKGLLNKAIGGMVLGAVLLTAIPSSVPAQAATYKTSFSEVQGSNGQTVRYYNSKSDVLIIGDSRTVQMYNYSKGKCSFVSMWGGHYYRRAGAKYNYCSIDNDDNRSAIRDIVKKKKGMHVYVFATINDYAGTGAYEGAVSNLNLFAKQVKKWGKDDTVTVVELVKSKNGKPVTNFNKRLREVVKKQSAYNKKTYKLNTDIAYDTDNLHYTGKTAKNIVNELLTKAEKEEAKAISKTASTAKKAASEAETIAAELEAAANTAAEALAGDPENVELQAAATTAQAKAQTARQAATAARAAATAASGADSPAAAQTQVEEAQKQLNIAKNAKN